MPDRMEAQLDQIESQLDQLKRNKLDVIIHVLWLIAFIYLFILAVKLLGDSFKGLGSDYARSLFETTANPIVGLLIGILATSIVQSSSSTTSTIVALVAAGTLKIEWAIPMVMGANIGTTVTNTMVSFAHINRRQEFGRAYAGAVVHDIFNVLAVLLFLPLQHYTNFLGRASLALTDVFESAGGFGYFGSPLNYLVKPLAYWMVSQFTGVEWLGVIVALLLLFVSLRFIVVNMRYLVLSRIESFFGKYLFRNTGSALLVGFLFTAILQSSSITLSLALPLLGARVLTLSQMYPYTLGANVGTTLTAIFAALVAGESAGMTVAFAHLMFNMCGMAVFLPLKRIPISLAERLAYISERKRYVPILIIIVMFFAIPFVLVSSIR